MRLLITLGVLAFAFLWTADCSAGIRHRERTIKRHLTVRVERKVEKKRETPIRLIPSRCQGGKCATK